VNLMKAFSEFCVTLSGFVGQVGSIGYF